MSTLSVPIPREVATDRLPPLETGDHLDQPTFHARYEAMPRTTHAELIGGIVFVSSPLLISHGDYHALVMHWLGEYRMHTPGTRALDNATVILGYDIEPQPDAMLLIDPSRGGQTRIDDRGYLNGPPELIVEIASSSEAYDLHEKYRDYERAGVLEYAVVMLRDRAVRWFVREEDRFKDLTATSDGVFQSPAMSGLWLDVPALFAQNNRQLVEVLKQGIATPEHAAFVKRLGI